MGYQHEQRSLTKEQKEAIGILSVGTFLEYFDLMLYVHMVEFFNKLFFKPTDSHTLDFGQITIRFGDKICPN